MKSARVALISDTHGLLRWEAIEHLRGSDYIVHAGDIGAEEMLDRLREIAPVTAVRGNNDRGAWADTLPDTAELMVLGFRLLVIHDIATLPAHHSPSDYRAVISGHSHKPKIEEKNGVYWINPGSAGPRRFKLPISLGYLDINKNGCAARIMVLND